MILNDICEKCGRLKDFCEEKGWVCPYCDCEKCEEYELCWESDEDSWEFWEMTDDEFY